MPKFIFDIDDGAFDDETKVAEMANRMSHLLQQNDLIKSGRIRRGRVLDSDGNAVGEWTYEP